MIVIGLLEAAQEDPDGGYAAENSRPGFGLRLFLERALIADMHVRIEYPGKHDLAPCIQGFPRRSGQFLAQGRNATAGYSDIGGYRSDARNDERAMANHQVETACAAAARHGPIPLRQELVG